MRPERDILWSERTRDEFYGLARRGAVVVIPVGSTEQHGLHLSVDTDCRTAEHVARTAARVAEDVPVLVTPTIPVAISPHHLMYPGTISLRTETLLHILEDMGECIVGQGFDRILFLNGHGGNRALLEAAALELRHRLDRQIRACTWFDLVADVMQAIREGPGQDIGHSGELETSAIMAIAPDAVREDRLVLVEGITDDPSRGTVDKGQRLLNAAVERVAALIRNLAASVARGIPGIEQARE